MKNYKYIKVVSETPVTRIILNRPDVRNALNIDMIEEISETYEQMNKVPDIKYIVLEAVGEDFSAGADINWMKASVGLSLDENKEEALKLAALFYTIYSSSKITVAKIHGNIIGGGNGLAAVNDIVLAAEDCNFLFSETRLGIIPATILPYVQMRIGSQHAKVKTLLAMPFGIQEAFRIGMVDFIVKRSELHSTEKQVIDDLKHGAYEAQSHFKKFQREMNVQLPENIIDRTAEAIAESRTSESGQEGLNAFLERRKPKWM